MKRIFSVLLVLLAFYSCKSTAKYTEAASSPKEFSSDFVLALGSCNKQNLEQPLWEEIVRNDPDVFVWGGDNIYGDSDDMSKLEADYAFQKTRPGYQFLLSSTSIIGTWDDHDYGKNDSGADWHKKEESQQLFLDFMDVPKSSPRRSREGVYHSEIYETEKGKIKIILLDTRYFRSALKPNDDPTKRYSPASGGTILGKEQWEWLERELNSDSADFNILVSSIQFLSREHGFETWGNFPEEVIKLENLIRDSSARNVILLSGDRHLSEFSKTEPQGLDYPLIDFTSSGLTHTYSSFTGEPNRFRFGEVITEISFGLLSFDFDRMQVLMQMRGTDNRIIQEHLQSYKKELND